MPFSEKVMEWTLYMYVAHGCCKLWTRTVGLWPFCFNMIPDLLFFQPRLPFRNNKLWKEQWWVQCLLGWCLILLVFPNLQVVVSTLWKSFLYCIVVIINYFYHCRMFLQCNSLCSSHKGNMEHKIEHCSGAHNDGFLQNTLKTLFKLTRVLLDI